MIDVHPCKVILLHLKKLSAIALHKLITFEARMLLFKLVECLSYVKPVQGQILLLINILTIVLFTLVQLHGIGSKDEFGIIVSM